MAITFWSFPSSAWSGWGDGLGPQHSVGAVFILGYHVGKWNFLAEVAMHLIILLILLVALVAIIVWLADWTSGPRPS